MAVIVLVVIAGFPLLGAADTRKQLIQTIQTIQAIPENKQIRNLPPPTTFLPPPPTTFTHDRYYRKAKCKYK